MTTHSSKLDGLHPVVLRPRVEALLAEPRAKALGLYVVSGFRSIERQRVLFQEAVRKYGSEAAARKWVAPPGKSNHGPSLNASGNKVADQIRDGKWGGAVDLGVRGVQVVSGQWPEPIVREVDYLAAKNGLRSPMDWEDWHFEPIPGWVKPAADPKREVSRMASPLGGAWILQADGGVVTQGSAPFYGSYWSLPPEQRLGDRTFKKITPYRGGYALVSTKNEFFHFPPK